MSVVLTLPPLQHLCQLAALEPRDTFHLCLIVFQVKHTMIDELVALLVESPSDLLQTHVDVLGMLVIGHLFRDVKLDELGSRQHEHAVRNRMHMNTM